MNYDPRKFVIPVVLNKYEHMIRSIKILEAECVGRKDRTQIHYRIDENIFQEITEIIIDLNMVLIDRKNIVEINDVYNYYIYDGDEYVIMISFKPNKKLLFYI